jgi:hypothetical protein
VANEVRYSHPTANRMERLHLIEPLRAVESQERRIGRFKAPATDADASAAADGRCGSP